MLPAEIYSKNVLISPLNWGMGHVSRCIPLIDRLLKQDNLIFIACDEFQKQIFSYYFKNKGVTYIDHAGYPFEFKGKGRFLLDTLSAINRLRVRKSNELTEVENIVKLYNIDVAISDHRYGFFSKKCTSIFMTHQLNLPVKGLFQLVQKLHIIELRKFNFIWVLDEENSTFAGQLSLRNKKLKVHYIGILSRFSLYPKTEKTHPTVVVVSGPEPYAEHFFLEQLSNAKMRTSETIIISPKTYITPALNENKIQIMSSESWIEKDEVIRKAKKVISRSGYTTIMDVIELKADFEYVPTKGQAEQIYLSKLHQK